jgi:hypothetical protein
LRLIGLAVDLSLRECYEDSDDIPTVILHGHTEAGPVTVHVKSKALEVDGLVMGTSIGVTFE